MSLFDPHGSQGRPPCNYKLASQTRHEKCTLGNHEDSSGTNDEVNDSGPCMHPRIDVAMVDACEGGCVDEPYNAMKSDGIAAKKRKKEEKRPEP